MLLLLAAHEVVGVPPGLSSRLGGIDEFPLLRDSRCSSLNVSSTSYSLRVKVFSVDR